MAEVKRKLIKDKETGLFKLEEDVKVYELLKRSVGNGNRAFAQSELDMLMQIAYLEGKVDTIPKNDTLTLEDEQLLDAISYAIDNFKKQYALNENDWLV